MKRQSRGHLRTHVLGEFTRQAVPVGTQSGSPHSDISRICFSLSEG